jgi:DNA-binding transcriptional MerR regulator
MSGADSTTTDGYGIAEVAEATGVSAHTLRYYERAGLMLDPVPRGSSRHRRYRETDIGWVAFLTQLRKTGMPIKQIRQYAELVRDGRGNEGERLALLELHRTAVVQQIEELRCNLQALERKIEDYRASSRR